MQKPEPSGGRSLNTILQALKLPNRFAEDYGKHRHNISLKHIIFIVYNDIEKRFHLIHKLEWNFFWDRKLPHYLKKVAVLNVSNTTVKTTKQAG